MYINEVKVNLNIYFEKVHNFEKVLNFENLEFFSKTKLGEKETIEMYAFSRFDGRERDGVFIPILGLER